MKLYMTELCPDCPPIVELLKRKGLDVEIVNISGHILKLKEFIQLRDHHPDFEQAKINGWIGVPALLTDDNHILFEEAIRQRFDV